jgi:hypothetical protein
MNDPNYYTNKLNAWYKDQRENHGLLDMKITPGDLSNATVESMAKECLHIIENSRPAKLEKGF